MILTSEIVTLFLGTDADFERGISEMPRDDRIRARLHRARQANNIRREVKITDARPRKVESYSWGFTGITAGGKRFRWDRNNGVESRSRYCGALSIEGKCVFPSGTSIAAWRHIAQN